PTDHIMTDITRKIGGISRCEGACGDVQIEPMVDLRHTPSPENGRGREYDLRLSEPAACKVWDVTVIRPDEHVDSAEREVFHEQVDTLGRARKLFAELRKLY